MWYTRRRIHPARCGLCTSTYSRADRVQWPPLDPRGSPITDRPPGKPRTRPSRTRQAPLPVGEQEVGTAPKVDNSNGYVCLSSTLSRLSTRPTRIMGLEQEEERKEGLRFIPGSPPLPVTSQRRPGDEQEKGKNTQKNNTIAFIAIDLLYDMAFGSRRGFRFTITAATSCSSPFIIRVRYNVVLIYIPRLLYIYPGFFCRCSRLTCLFL